MPSRLLLRVRKAAAVRRQSLPVDPEMATAASAQEMLLIPRWVPSAFLTVAILGLSSGVIESLFDREPSQVAKVERESHPLTADLGLSLPESSEESKGAKDESWRRGEPVRDEAMLPSDADSAAQSAGDDVTASDGSDDGDLVAEDLIDHLTGAAMSRVLRSDEVLRSGVDLRELRNGIYARYGYQFASPELRDAFSKREWYRPQEADMAIVWTRMSPEARESVRMVKQLEVREGLE